MEGERGGISGCDRVGRRTAQRPGYIESSRRPARTHHGRLLAGWLAGWLARLRSRASVPVTLVADARFQNWVYIDNRTISLVLYLSLNNLSLSFTSFDFR
jgi:hypothetical protein